MSEQAKKEIRGQEMTNENRDSCLVLTLARKRYTRNGMGLCGSDTQLLLEIDTMDGVIIQQIRDSDNK
jgi:hypothetical protein